METNTVLQASFRYNQLLVEKLGVIPEEMSLKTWMDFCRNYSDDIQAYEEFLADPRPLGIKEETKFVNEKVMMSLVLDYLNKRYG